MRKNCRENDEYDTYLQGMESYYRAQGDFDSAMYCQELGKLWRDYSKMVLVTAGPFWPPFRGIIEVRLPQ